MPIIRLAIERNGAMPSGEEAPVALELDDIQSGALRPRPSPYVGVFILLRIDDRRAGRELLRRLIPALADATSPAAPWTTWPGFHSHFPPMPLCLGARHTVPSSSSIWG